MHELIKSSIRATVLFMYYIKLTLIRDEFHPEFFLEVHSIRAIKEPMRNQTKAQPEPKEKAATIRLKSFCISAARLA